MPNYTPHRYQQEAVDYLLDRIICIGHKGGGIFADPGLGKTLMTLMFLWELQAMMRMRVLIVCPLRCCYSVWPAEVKKFGFPYSVGICHGTKQQRLKVLRGGHDITVINPEGLRWLANERHGFNVLIVDESTLFKNWSAKRTRALRQMLKQFEVRLILTGTPTPRSLNDIFAQHFFIDDGEALGTSITAFRTRFCQMGGHRGQKFEFNGAKADELNRLIKDSVVRLDMHDHLDLPPIVYNNIWVQLPPAVRRAYEVLEKEFFFELKSQTVDTTSIGQRYSMLKCIANGGVYTRDEFNKRVSTHVHDAKLEALQDLKNELHDKPMLVPYQFQHDREIILKHHPNAEVVGGGVRAKDAPAIFDRWNRGEIETLLLQPKSVSHGVNLQAGGNHIAWFGLTDELELYQQLNARLYRQGVQGTVVVNRILAEGTVDEAILERTEEKGRVQKSLLDSLRDYSKKQMRNRPACTASQVLSKTANN
ncbi:MAG: DEAD/DEAH box helicase [Planctomycetales bacterium]|nr:DEAD/DEAH box helicase [Planctomycetales bacterium]